MNPLLPTVYIIALLCTVYFFIQASRRLYLAMARPVLAFSINLSVISFFQLVPLIYPTPTWQQLNANVILLGLSLQLPIWLWMLVEYHYEYRINSPWLLLSLLDPLLTSIFFISTMNGGQPSIHSLGVYAEFHRIYMIFVGMFVLTSLSVWVFYCKGKHHFLEIALFTIAMCTPPILTYLYATGLIQLQLGAPSLILLIFWATQQYGLLDVMPVATSTILKNLNSGVMIFNSRWHLLYANDYALRTFRMNGKTKPGSTEHLQKLFDSRSSFGQKHKIMLDQHGMFLDYQERSDKHSFYEVSLEPLSNAQQKHLGHSLLIQDISEQTKRSATLLQQKDQLALFNKQKSEFFAGISHEFRTPLTLSTGYLKNIDGGKYGQQIKGAQEPLNIVINNNERLLSLVNQLLELSRLDSANFKIRVEKIDLEQRLLFLLSNFEAVLNAKKIGLVWDINEPAPALYVDPECFDKIVFNLISNAIKAMSNGGKLTIRTCFKNDNTIVLDIGDTGCGIDDDILPNIFEPFVYREHISKHWPKGVGVGLSLVKQLLEQHQADINVANTSVLGTTFRIRFKQGSSHFSKAQLSSSNTSIKPTSQDFTHAVTTKQHDESTKPNSESNLPTLLLVDDNNEMRAFIRELLQTDYDIIEASDGASALALCLKHCPDVVLSDVMMPLMNGVEMCEKIKSNIQISHTPVLLLTAKSGEQDKIEGLEQGADDYLTKPFNTKELALRLANLIHRQTQLKVHYTQLLTSNDLPNIVLPKTEITFLQTLKQHVELRIDDPGLRISDLADSLHMSERNLNRKLKNLIDISPKKLLLEMRLMHAHELVCNSELSVAQISDACGFGDTSYFSRKFKEHFRSTPSDYRKQERPIQ